MTYLDSNSVPAHTSGQAPPGANATQAPQLPTTAQHHTHNNQPPSAQSIAPDAQLHAQSALPSVFQEISNNHSVAARAPESGSQNGLPAQLLQALSRAPSHDPLSKPTHNNAHTQAGENPQINKPARIVENAHTAHFARTVEAAQTVENARAVDYTQVDHLVPAQTQKPTAYLRAKSGKPAASLANNSAQAHAPARPHARAEMPPVQAQSYSRGVLKMPHMDLTSN